MLKIQQLLKFQTYNFPLNLAESSRRNIFSGQQKIFIPAQLIKKSKSMKSDYSNQLFNEKVKFSDLRNLNKSYQPQSNMKYSRLSSVQDPQKHDRNNKRLFSSKPSRRQNQQLWLQDALQWIKLSSVNIYNLRQSVKKLYDSCSYKKASLFGMNINNLKNQMQDTNYQNKKPIYLLWSLYQTWKWQNVGIKNIEQYIKIYPSRENQVQQIEIENNKIKLNKLDMSLEINTVTGQYVLGPKLHQFNRFLGQFYSKSITKINYQSNSFQFRDEIRQIQSNDLLIAVKTDSQLFVINPVRKIKEFNIRAKDIAICKNKCYFARQNGTIGTIFMQTAYQPKLNELAIQETIYNDILKPRQFLVSNDQLVLIVNINVDDELISIRKLEGRPNSFGLNIEPQQNEQLVNKKAFIQGNYLQVLFFLGIGRDITRIVEYKFYIIDL